MRVSLSSLAFLVGVIGGLPSLQARADEIRHVRCETETTKMDLKDRKLIKSVTPEFWKVLENQIAHYPSSLQVKGWIVGDFHFKNVGLYLDPQDGQIRLSLNDLDDAGTNYLVGDLLKYLIYLRTMDKKLDFSALLKSYVSGLQAHAEKPPKALRKLFEMSPSEFQDKQEKYIRKQIQNGSRLPPTEMTADQKATLFEIMNSPWMVENYHDLEGWVQIHDSGSSAGMERFLISGTSIRSGAPALIEFKSLKCSATGPQTEQDLQENYRRSLEFLASQEKILGPNDFLRRQKVLLLDGRYYLMREKTRNLISSLDLESEDGDKLQNFAEFFANYLGLVHSASATASYIDAVKSQKDLLIGDLKPLLQQFKDLVTP